MRLHIFVKFGRQPKIFLTEDGQLAVMISKPPVDGAANKQLVEVVADWLGVPKSGVRVLKGHTSRFKVVEIDIKESNWLEKLQSLSPNEA